ncbi:S8 family serine peptidase [bacterium]|nr:S8 family serine peptidase [bacterium]
MKICIFTILALILNLNGAQASLKPRWIPPKPEHTVLDDNCYKYCITIKFIENSSVRLRDDRLVSLNGSDLKPFYRVFNSYKIKNFKRLFSRSEHLLDAERETGQQRSGKQLGDLNNYYRVELDSSENPEAFIDDLNRLDIIEITYANPKYVECDDIPPETPDYSDRQGYLYEAPDGIDAVAAWEHVGGKGENVKIVHFAGGCFRDHEDLKELFYYVSFWATGGNHGTAMLGTLVAGHNEYGVNGICPEASIGLFAMPDCPFSLAEIINVCSENIDEGDIMFNANGVWVGNNIELPVEFVQENFDVIENVVANGKIFIEVAVNDNRDLDDERFEGRFDPEERHSGAIIVGAGAPPVGDHGEPRSRIEFSNYGSRVDLQAWGREIVTCGYGDLFYPDDDSNQRYTSDFGGTCGASAIVTGAAACLQGMCKTRTDCQIILTPEQVRNILVDTGTPQNEEGYEGHIGPQPDLSAAMEELEFPFGYLSGTITDVATDAPIPGALVKTRCEETLTDDEGNWIIEEAIALGEVFITAVVDGYIDSTSVVFDFEEDDTLDIDLSLLHPEFVLSDSMLSLALEHDSSLEITITIENNGNGFLNWSAEKTIINDNDIVDWELRNVYSAGEILNDVALGGVLFIHDRYFITGGGGDTNYVYILDGNFELTGRFVQPTDSRNGIRDLAFNGELIFGVDDNLVYGFSTEGDLRTSFEGPYDHLNAITWDSDRHAFWVSGIASRYIWCVTEDGEILDSTLGINMQKWGLAYYPEDPEDYTLYVNSYNEGSPAVYKINPSTGEYLPVAVFPNDGECEARGAFITADYSRDSWSFISILHNGVNDLLEIRQLGQKNWLDVDELEGRLESEQDQEINLTINSSWLPAGLFPAQLAFEHNAAGGEYIFNIELTVQQNYVVDDRIDTPSEFGIISIYPNPFNSSTCIVYNLNGSGFTRLQIFDLTGRKVATLVESYRNVGTYDAIWNAEDIPSGLYFVRLKTQDKERFRKLLLIR